MGRDIGQNYGSMSNSLIIFLSKSSEQKRRKADPMIDHHLDEAMNRDESVRLSGGIGLKLASFDNDGDRYCFVQWTFALKRPNQVQEGYWSSGLAQNDDRSVSGELEMANVSNLWLTGKGRFIPWLVTLKSEWTEIIRRVRGILGEKFSSSWRLHEHLLKTHRSKQIVIFFLAIDLHRKTIELSTSLELSLEYHRNHDHWQRWKEGRNGRQSTQRVTRWENEREWIQNGLAELPLAKTLFFFFFPFSSRFFSSAVRKTRNKQICYICAFSRRENSVSCFISYSFQVIDSNLCFAASAFIIQTRHPDHHEEYRLFYPSRHWPASEFLLDRCDSS